MARLQRVLGPVFVAAFLSACSMFGSDGSLTPVISDGMASDYGGQTVTVEGIVAEVTQSSRGSVFLNFGAAYPNQSFTAQVQPQIAHSLPALAKSRGLLLDVTGTVTVWQGKPVIVVASPDQIVAH